MLRCLKVLLAVFLSLMFTVSLAKLVLCLWSTLYVSDKSEADEWLEENTLGQYKQIFREQGRIYYNLNNIFYIESLPRELLKRDWQY